MAVDGRNLSTFKKLCKFYIPCAIFIFIINRFSEKGHSLLVQMKVELRKFIIIRLTLSNAYRYCYKDKSKSFIYFLMSDSILSKKSHLLYYFD